MNLYKVDTKFVFCFVCCFGGFFCIRMFYWIYFCRKVKTFKWYVCAYSIALVFSVKQLSIWKKIRRKTRSDIVIDNREISFCWSHRVFWYEVCPKLLCLSQFCDFWKKKYNCNWLQWKTKYPRFLPWLFTWKILQRRKQISYGKIWHLKVTRNTSHSFFLMLSSICFHVCCNAKTL